MGISVVINTYNADLHLDKVLEAVKDFDEILLCDMNSTDKTIQIAKKHNCKIIYHEHTGIVEPARNTTIQAASQEWVLIIDADEIVTPELKEYLYQQISLPNPPDAIRIPRKNYFMGKFMRATYPDYLLRFSRKEVIYWPPFVHAIPHIKGKTITIPAHKKELAFIHLANESVADYIRKINAYSDKEVERRKSKRYTLLDIVIQVNFRFFRQYFLKKGILDGIPGFCNAVLSAYYKFATMAKVYEYQYNKQNNSQVGL
ncbi:glycosyltransferase family 2 protein [uncultured Parabacteroides sp.]|uniref:glycosyltransferase family 2 protein n=1 Tax=uncultured Parabacteroides sp. TaxID=512312 RepID=UPI002634A676|nr:glycosyltransferase family 2 protein [uncultured Parabacteroides sp.]